MEDSSKWLHDHTQRDFLLGWLIVDKWTNMRIGANLIFSLCLLMHCPSFLVLGVCVNVYRVATFLEIRSLLALQFEQHFLCEFGVVLLCGLLWCIAEARIPLYWANILWRHHYQSGC